LPSLSYDKNVYRDIESVRLFSRSTFSAELETFQFSTTKSTNFYEMPSCDWSVAFVSIGNTIIDR